MNAHKALIGAAVAPRRRLFCSFCAAADDQSEVLISGCDVYICSACVELCVEIVQTHRKTWAGDAEYASWLAALQESSVYKPPGEPK